MVRRYKFFLTVMAFWVCLSCCCRGYGAEQGKRVLILSPREASVLETLAAREVHRYVYLRTGELLPILEEKEKLPEDAPIIVVAAKNRPVVKKLALDAQIQSSLERLKAQDYLLRTVNNHGRRVVFILGGDDVGTLYAAYRFAEHLGVRFYLHGDVVPDRRIALEFPDLNEVGEPLFNLRGIQPFHDFPEGPD
jgi:hypothetical protein